MTALSSATAGTYAFRPQRAGRYAIVAIDQAEPIPSEQNRAFFERILKSGQTITLAENERRAVDLRVGETRRGSDDSCPDRARRISGRDRLRGPGVPQAN